MLKIVLIGSECSGKTSLAKALAEYYKTEYLEEYSRIYAQRKEGELTYQDVIPIGKGQKQAEEEFINNSQNQLLIFDTCLLSTYIYSKIYYKKVPDELREWLQLELYDHFFLTFPDPEWEEDGIRSLPMSRKKMHEVFQSELDSFDLSYTEIKGNQDQRMHSIIKQIKASGSNKF